MKKLSIVLMALLFVTARNPVLAKTRQKTERQKQKAEMKVWKRRKAGMQPFQLKDLVEENKRLKAQNRRLVEETQFAKDAIEAELLALKMQIEAQKEEQCRQSKEAREVATAFAGLSSHDWAIDKDGQYYIKGVVFKVQIGAYKKRDLSDILGDKVMQATFEQEQIRGVNMYTLGHLRSYWKANQFRKELRAMGFKDAWIVAFEDGKRMPLKKVLQEVIKSKKK